MRITRNMLESCVSETNSAYGLSLSVQYFNGRTHLYFSGSAIETGSTPKCYNALLIFMSGVRVGMQLEANKSEVK